MTGPNRSSGSAVVSGASADQWSDADPWTVLRLILWSADYLTNKGVSSGRLDAEHLLAHVLGVKRLQLIPGVRAAACSGGAGRLPTACCDDARPGSPCST